MTPREQYEKGMGMAFEGMSETPIYEYAEWLEKKHTALLERLKDADRLLMNRVRGWEWVQEMENYVRKYQSR